MLSAIDRSPDLHLVARTYAEGVYQGRHRTRDRGSSTEFYDYRAYTPGDPTQLIDWRLYGRTDRLYIRRFQQESQLTVLLVVDGSASMYFGGVAWARQPADSRDMSATKFRRACEFAATLAYMTIRQGDRVGLVLSGVETEAGPVPADRPIAVPPATGWMTLNSIIRALETARPRRPKTGPGTALTEGFEFVDHLMRGGGLIIGIGDGLEQPDALLPAMSRARWPRGGGTAGRQREVSLLQVLTHDELDIRDLGGARLVDTETGVQVRTHSDQIHASYRKQIEAHQRRLSIGVSSMHGRHHVCITSHPPVDQLRAFLAGR